MESAIGLTQQQVMHLVCLIYEGPHKQKNTPLQFSYYTSYQLQIPLWISLSSLKCLVMGL